MNCCEIDIHRYSIKKRMHYNINTITVARVHISSNIIPYSWGMGQHNYISIPYTLVLSLCIRYRVAGNLKAQGKFCYGSSYCNITNKMLCSNIFLFVKCSITPLSILDLLSKNCSILKFHFIASLFSSNWRVESKVSAFL